jgi:hypothetical protein
MSSFINERKDMWFTKTPGFGIVAKGPVEPNISVAKSLLSLPDMVRESSDQPPPISKWSVCTPLRVRQLMTPPLVVERHVQRHIFAMLKFQSRFDPRYHRCLRHRYIGEYRVILTVVIVPFLLYIDLHPFESRQLIGKYQSVESASPRTIVQLVRPRKLDQYHCHCGPLIDCKICDKFVHLSVSRGSAKKAESLLRCFRGGRSSKVQGAPVYLDCRFS